MNQVTLYMKKLREEMAKAGVLDAETMRKSPLLTTDLTSYGGLKAEEASGFIDLVVAESVLLQNIRIHRTDAPSGTLSKMTVSGPITQGAAEGTAVADTSKPTASSVDYVTKKTVSQMDISGEFTEDNIEGQGGRNTVLNMMTKQIGNDMETLSLEGDTSETGTTAKQKLIKVNNGFLKLTASGTGAHIVDCGGTGVSLALLVTMLRAMPTKWRRNLGDLRWIMSANTELSLIAQLATIPAGLGISGLSDTTKVSGALPGTLLGIKPLVVPLMPEDLAIDGVDDDTGTVIMLCNPQNLVYVVQRDLMIEWERVPRGDLWQSTIHMRTDQIVENTDAVVRTTNLNADIAATPYGDSSGS